MHSSECHRHRNEKNVSTTLKHSNDCLAKFSNLNVLRQKNQDKQVLRDELIKDAHQEYIDTANIFLEKVRSTLETAVSSGPKAIALVFMIENFMKHADRQTDQIHCRVILDEKVPHSEKVFLIFEGHAEWVSKEKAGVPVELELKVCVLEDQYVFILHHRVMEHETDYQVAIIMVE